MKKAAILAAFAIFPMFAIAQPVPTPADQVSVSAKGSDVRTVLCDLFGQAKKSFVVAPDIHFALYLALDKIDFDEALLVVCHTARLKLEIQNGIYYITKMPASKTTTTVDTVDPKPQKRTVTPVGPLPKSVLRHHVTTKLTKADIRGVFAELSKQSEVPIEVDKAVPAYKLTAFLKDTSLKYALDHVTKAANLQYRFTDNGTILIFASTSEAKPDAENLVSLDKG